MPNTIDNFEMLIIVGTKMLALGQKTVEERIAWLNKEFISMEETPEALREIFQNALPGENVTFSGEEAEYRKRVSENARAAYIRLGAERAIPAVENTPREIGALYRSGNDQKTLDYNENLRKVIAEKNYAALGDLYEEYLQNLPSYDSEMLLSLSPEEAPAVLCSLYDAFVASQEGHKLLTASTEPSVTIRSRLSEKSKQMLQKLINDMDAFSELKIRCDNIAKPHYAYIDTEKILNTPAYSDLMDKNRPRNLSDTSSLFYDKLGDNIGTITCGLNYRVGLCLENSGFDMNQTVLRDSFGKTYNLFSDARENGCRDVLQRGEPLFCTSGGKLKVLTLKDGKIAETQPAQALESCLDLFQPALKKADDILNGSVASPLWMFTGSSQYRGMKRALAAYTRLAKGGVGDVELKNPKAHTALEKLQASALAYLQHKGVDLEKLPDYKTFCYDRDDYPAFEHMSKRELARMEAAYSVLAYTQNKLKGFALRKELREMPAYHAYQTDGDVVVTYSERVQQANAQIRQSNFLAVAGENTVAETLRQDIADALFKDPNGLLHKKIFTAQDRQVVEDTLAKAVILDIIRVGHKMTDTDSLDIEVAYQDNPISTMDLVKQSDAFREAVGNRISPDGLRNFFMESRQTVVNKSLVNAVKQKIAENELWNEQQLTKQAANEVKMEETNLQITGMK